MGFSYILAIFYLFMGSPLPGLAEGFNSTTSSHHRVRRHSCEGESTCPVDFEMYNGVCYYFSAKARPGYLRHHFEAEDECQILGALGEKEIHLAEMGENGDTDLWLMKKIIEQDYPVWLGATADENNQWTWTTSQRELPLDYPLWGPNQPNKNQKCLSTLQYGGRIPHRQFLGDSACGHTLDYAYVCQLFCSTGSHGPGVDHSHPHLHPHQQTTPNPATEPTTSIHNHPHTHPHNHPHTPSTTVIKPSESPHTHPHTHLARLIGYTQFIHH